MTATKTNYTVNTDAGLTRGILADDFDDAARQWAVGEKVKGIDDLADLLAYIEGVDGAWLWIENTDTLERHYAGSENMG